MSSSCLHWCRAGQWPARHTPGKHGLRVSRLEHSDLVSIAKNIVMLWWSAYLPLTMSLQATSFKIASPSAAHTTYLFDRPPATQFGQR